jgi:hypothetical protein
MRTGRQHPGYWLIYQPPHEKPLGFAVYRSASRRHDRHLATETVPKTALQWTGSFAYQRCPDSGHWPLPPLVIEICIRAASIQMNLIELNWEPPKVFNNGLLVLHNQQLITRPVDYNWRWMPLITAHKAVHGKALDFSHDSWKRLLRPEMFTDSPLSASTEARIHFLLHNSVISIWKVITSLHSSSSIWKNFTAQDHSRPSGGRIHQLWVIFRTTFVRRIY